MFEMLGDCDGEKNYATGRGGKPNVMCAGQGRCDMFYLVVDNNVDAPAGGVVREVAEMESFVDDALAGEATVAMHEHGHVLDAVFVMRVVLLRSSLANHHRRHSLQMARVCYKRQMNVLPTSRRPVVGCAQVVLHIATPRVASFLHLHRLDARTELAEDVAQGLPHHIAQNIQPPSVRHAYDYALHPMVCSCVYQFLHAHNNRTCLSILLPKDFPVVHCDWVPNLPLRQHHHHIQTKAYPTIPHHM